MVKSSKIEQTYQQYKKQIDIIFTMSEGNARKAAKIVAWFYGGSWETWRKFLSKTSVKPPEKDVLEFLKRILERKG